MNTNRKSHLWMVCLAVLFLLLLLLSCISMQVGAKNISPNSILKALFFYDSSKSSQVIIRTSRFPRTLAAIMVGASFSVSGAIMQGTTRNPMASPSILGINAGAGFGLALALIFFPAASLNMTVLCSFLGAALSTAIIFLVSSLGRSNSQPLKLALVGTAITAMFNAVSQALAVGFKLSQDLTFWNAGGISGIRPAQIRLLFPYTLSGLIIALFMARSVTILSLGEEVAVGLGGKTRQIRFFSSLAVLILTGSAVAIAGPIGFIGLVVPHAVRALVGMDYRKVIPCGMLAGAVLLLLADIVSRLIHPPFETPVGAVTALIGVPFFIGLANKNRKRGEK